MAQMGMDVDAVEAAGRDLQAKAQSIDMIVSNLDKTVGSLNGAWDGKDAQTFVNEWWPERKKAFTAASSSIAGLGQSALNNASEQRQASGVSGSGAAAGTAAGIAALAVAGGQSTSGSVPTGVGATSGTLPPADEAAYHQFETHSTSHTGTDGTYLIDANGKGVDNCTAWADWRRAELGLSTAHGSGGEMAANAGGTPGTPPTLGAIGSYSPSDAGSDGHVVIVEGMTPGNPPTIHISEVNYLGSPTVHFRDLTQGADGKWYGQAMGSSGYAITFSPAA
jgi:uncharacterized protein YukE